MTLEERLKGNRDEILRLAVKYGTRNVREFGSLARGELRPESDVDLLIEFKPDSQVGLLDLEEIRAEFESLFGRRVDLAGPSILRNPYRRRAILRDLRPVYGT
jgi:uncharacterized protein